MKVLSVGRDKDLRLFEEGSAIRARMIEYGKYVEELHITVFALKNSGLSPVAISSNVFVHPTNSFSRWLFVWDAIRMGKKIILEKKFIAGQSVITCQDPFECGFVGWRISKHFSLPLHIQTHTDFLSQYFQTSFFQKLRVFIARFLLPKANYVRVVSNRIADSLKKSGIVLQHEPRVLPVFVDGEKIENEISGSGVNLQMLFPRFKFIILMASRLSEEKRIDDALLVVSRIVSAYPYVGLIVAGDGPLRGYLEQKATSLGIRNHIEFLGWRSDVAYLMKSAHMFLSTSAYEGYGMSIIEAGLAKCPVLSTQVGISGELLVHDKNSFLCPVGDTICMYAGVASFVTDNIARYKLSGQLYIDVKAHLLTKEEYAKKYVALLEEASGDTPQ